MPKTNQYRDYLKQEMSELIEKIDLSDLQRRFMKSRWLDQVLWLESRATKSRNRHYGLRLITIIGGVIVPALVSVNSSNSRNLKLGEIFGWTAFGLSQAVAISAAVEELFSYGENYRRYRNTAEGMKIAGWQFFQLSGPYQSFKSHSEAYSVFATNVENIIEQDVEGYVKQATQADAESRAATQAAIAQNVALANMQLREQLQRAVPEPPPISMVTEYDEYGTSPIQNGCPSALEEDSSAFSPAWQHQESEDEFLTVDELQNHNFAETARNGGSSPTSTFPNSATFPGNSTPGDEDDEFLTPDRIHNVGSPSLNPPASFNAMPPQIGSTPAFHFAETSDRPTAASTSSFPASATFAANSPPVVAIEDDEFVTPDQIRGHSN